MTDAVTWTAITDQPIDARAVEAAVASDTSGAVVTFTGRVRDHDGGRAVDSLEYSAHPTAEGVLRDLCAAVAGRHEEGDAVTVAAVHRVGALGIGDVAVVVAVASAHRAAAFAACAELIEELKQTVPIWKRQHFAGGSSEWVGL